MTRSTDEASRVLRASGLRSTPQRRAILASFDGGRSEHLSADEVLARAGSSLPELSRGTVYATLAEFTEAGLLAAIGNPGPVRYEINTERHGHFRCRLCLRWFDVAIVLDDRRPTGLDGFHVERLDVRAEGICDECGDYERALLAGARAIRRTGPAFAAPIAADACALELETPVGLLTLAASARGVTRVAFSEHADADRLGSLPRGARSDRVASRHVSEAADQLEGYFGGAVRRPTASIDWSRLRPDAASALRATIEIPYATHRSYSDLGLGQPSTALGRTFGGNPIPLLTPCHRVARGTEVPAVYVAGPERRRWLEDHERRQAAGEQA
ncbi:MAG: transcriptional repressor [Solirubrobacterales bacterium]|nr:transcriptional repressor [Solirubrobacterales bacterium]MBV9714124.1 transcriptional repressor [Solirubrobacterales bacterium]